MKPTITPTIKQNKAWEYLQDKETRFLLFGGGAGGGKSWLGCEWLITNCYFYPQSKWFIGRQELSRLMKSSFVTFQKVCRFHSIPRSDWRLDGKYNYIEFKNGSRIDLLDLAYQPRDEDYQRFGSLEYTGGWIEEAGETQFKSFDILKTRVGRHLNNEFKLLPKIFLTCNPAKGWLYKLFYKGWKDNLLTSKYKFIQSLYKDNPHTADDYGRQLQEITDKATKERLMFGNWEYDDDPAILMEYDAILDVFTNTVEKKFDITAMNGYEEPRYMTVDVARFGKDKTVMFCWKGLEVYKIIVRTKQGTDVTADVIKATAQEEKIPYSRIVIDEDGIGGGVVDQVKGVKGFIANTAPIETIGKDKPNYSNLKAQCTYLLAEYVNYRKLSVKTEDEDLKEDLIEELEVIKSKDRDKDGKLKIIGKDEIKELIGRSPDYSDTLMMRMVFELSKDGGQLGIKQYKPKW